MAHWTLAALISLLLLLTLLPLSKRQEWWIRGLDFPRFQLGVLGVALVVAGVALLDLERLDSRLVLATAAACTLYQAWWILPYTPFYRKEVKSHSRPAADGDRLRVMSANVLMTNQRADALRALVETEQPDILITLETNRWWEKQLAPLEPRFPHSIRCPLENLYGMHLYSRLPLEDHRVQFLVESGVPSIHTLVVLPSGRRLRLHCLHPPPPSPTENETSRERDAELVMVGKAVAGASLPVIVTGDLNDVAWSATTRLFRKISRLLDPRVGRGRFNTFHANLPFCRWPVDHFFHSAHFAVVEIKRLRAFGSDHFPVLVELVLTDEPQGPTLTTDASDRREAEEKLQAEGAEPAKVHQPGERGRAETAETKARVGATAAGRG